MAVAFALAIIAFLYASVGHAGATGYIAIFALANYSATLIKPLALILNIAVASVGCWNFLRAGHFPEPKFAALYGLSIPAAFIGGSLNLPGLWFEKIVGVILLLSGLCLVEKPKDPINLQHVQVPLLFLAGGLLGLLAGFTGTGGGIFLTPLLLFTRWCNTRGAAAVSVLFVLLNSLAGFAGLLLSKPTAAAELLRGPMLLWLPVVFISGAIGSRLGSSYWPVKWIRYTLAIVLAIAGCKLLGIHWYS